MSEQIMPSMYAQELSAQSREIERLRTRLAESEAEVAALVARLDAAREDEAAACRRALAAERSRDEAREALREIAAVDREYPDTDDGDAECAECHSFFQTDDAHSPAPECWPCSSTLLERARMIARRVLSGEKEGA